MGLRIVMTKSVNTLRMTRLRRPPGGGFCGGPGAGAARVGLSMNTPFASFRKSCFRKDSQVRNACIFASFRKYAFAKILKFRKLSQI